MLVGHMVLVAVAFQVVAVNEDVRMMGVDGKEEQPQWRWLLWARILLVLLLECRQKGGWACSVDFSFLVQQSSALLCPTSNVEVRVYFIVVTENITRIKAGKAGSTNVPAADPCRSPLPSFLYA